MIEQLMNEAEIERVTGTSRQSLQREVLTRQGIFFCTDRNGKPHVTWYSFNHPAHLRFDKAMEHNEEPNFAALD